MLCCLKVLIRSITIDKIMTELWWCVKNGLEAVRSGGVCARSGRRAAACNDVHYLLKLKHFKAS